SERCAVGVVLLFACLRAEDGIRAFHVTGVQTCALPICFCAMDRGFTSRHLESPLILVNSLLLHVPSGQNICRKRILCGIRSVGAKRVVKMLSFTGEMTIVLAVVLCRGLPQFSPKWKIS